MGRAKRAPSALNEKEQLIRDALRAAARPLSAYDLIELLHENGVSSPPTVYRALKRLTDAGFAHRVESLNAFVCCSHDAHASSAAFAICDDCGSVTEFHHDNVTDKLDSWAQAQAFKLEKTTIELRGRCRSCTAGPTQSDA
jgi:Fur family transcriptional regulator, zinc uptake regulator